MSKFLHTMRHGGVKYAFEHAIVNLLLGAACIVLAFLGEARLWAMVVMVFVISICIQGFYTWRFIYRQQREYEQAQREEYERMREAD